MGRLPEIKRGQTLRILMISYKYLDKTIPFGNLAGVVKNYYELNSRGFIKFDITQRTISVPRLSTQIVSDSVEFVKKLLPNWFDKGKSPFDIYVHLCNPKTSRYGKKHVITWASTTNVIHEVGHAIGLSHANQTINGKIQTSRDAFSQMTIHAPYPSLNPVHRDQLTWYLDSEIIDINAHGENIYKLYKLSDLNDRTNLKVIRSGKFYISYGSIKSKNYLVVHKLKVEKPRGFFKWSSYLIARYGVVEGKEYKNEESGMCFEILKSTDKFIDLMIKRPLD